MTAEYSHGQKVTVSFRPDYASFGDRVYDGRVFGEPLNDGRVQVHIPAEGGIRTCHPENLRKIKL